MAITAPDDATAQKGIEALAAAGYHGQLETKAVHFPRDSGATKGKVSSLTLTGIHNCCGACNKAIKTAVKKVPGVTGDTAKPKTRHFRGHRRLRGDRADPRPAHGRLPCESQEVSRG